MSARSTRSLRRSTQEIREFLLENVARHPSDLSAVASERFGVTRQAINSHLRALVRQGLLRAIGSTRARRYELAILAREAKDYRVEGLQEDVVWRRDIEPLLSDCPENVLSICNYGFTEMLNNVIDHSGSEAVTALVVRTAGTIGISVIDRGIGIFRKISTELGLEDEHHAILELAKGKLTTDPERHSGEGVFFTSRMFDYFGLSSGELHLGSIDARDWLIDQNVNTQGTAAHMEISPRSKRQLKDVFDKFSSELGDYGFTRTHIPVTLARHEGERLVSRSQAKRLLARVNKFKEVVLDFENVATVGQAFADEIFRVFADSHSDVHIVWINTTPSTEAMIQRVLSRKRESEDSDSRQADS